MKSDNKAILEALRSGRICVKGPGEREVKPLTSFKTIVGFSSVENALTFMYAMRHTKRVCGPEYIVFNPHPSQPTGEFLLPQDLYLFEEASVILDMSFSKYLNYCKGLLNNRKVPVIGLIFAVDQRDIVRVTAQCLFENKYSELGGGHIPCLISVTGGTKEKNEKVWSEVSEETDKLCAEILTHLN